jgi:hypothetical protein
LIRYARAARSLFAGSKGVKSLSVFCKQQQLQAFVYKHRKPAMSRQENRLGAHATIKAVISDPVTDAFPQCILLHTQLLKHVPHARSSLITYYNIHSHMRSRGRQCGGGLHLRRAVAVCGYGDVNRKASLYRYHLSQQLYIRALDAHKRCAF